MTTMLNFDAVKDNSCFIFEQRLFRKEKKVKQEGANKSLLYNAIEITRGDGWLFDGVETVEALHEYP